MNRVQQFTLKAKKTLPMGIVSHFNGPVEWIHVENSNPNNTFMIGFNTIHNNSTGIQHILEHLCLESSKKYKKPFFHYLSTSLSNYMNALTGDDVTLYPFATTSKKDFENLLDIYLDSTLCPKLDYLGFLQEGWRWDNQFQGIVYNEMKGVFSDPSSYYHMKHQKELYKNSLYGFNSGGDPFEIPLLKHNDLVDFHQSRYNLSNACVFTYGTYPIEKLQDKLLAYLDVPGSRTTIDAIPKWTQHAFVHDTGPFDPNTDPEKQTRTSVSFLTNRHKDIQETYSMKLISDLLLDGAGSPMYKALIESEIGTDYGPTTGYHSYLDTTYQSFGVQGASKGTKIKEKVLETLHGVYKNGFPKQRIQSVLHQYELGIRHRTTQFGLNLGMDLIRTFFHGGNVFEYLDFEKNLEKAGKNLVQPEFIESKIKQYYLENTHVLEHVMDPDTEHASKVLEKEKKLQDEFRNRLTNQEENAWKKDCVRLEVMQNEPTDTTGLPTLTIKDVSLLNPTFEVTKSIVEVPNQKVDFFHRKTETNGICYFYLKVDISHIESEMLPLVPLLSRTLTSLGTKEWTLDQLDQQIRSFTGGMNVSYGVKTDTDNMEIREPYLVFSGNCLERNLEHLFDILQKIMNQPNWSRTAELQRCLAGFKSELAERVVDQGHSIATRLGASQLTPSAQLDEMWNGVSQIKFLETLGDIQAVSESLETLLGQMFYGQASAMMISGQKQAEDRVALLCHSFKSPKPALNMVFSPQYEKKNHVMDLGVNFVSRIMKCVPYTHPDSSYLALLASILTNQYLHIELREKRGAYGGFSRYQPQTGIFAFMTYRDPIGYQRTLDVFKNSIEWLETTELELYLEKAKLDVIKGFDQPLDASQEGLLHLYGADLKKRQDFRDRILHANVKDLTIVIDYLKQKHVDVVLGESMDCIHNI